MVELLLANGAYTNLACQQHTALHQAAAAGHVHICRLLLAAGANVDAPFIHRRPLHVACTSGPSLIHIAGEKSDPRVALLLLAYGANPRALDNAGRQALMLAEQEYDMHAETADAEWIFMQRCLLRTLRTLCQSPPSLKQLCHVVIRRNADILYKSARLLPPQVHTDVVTCETHDWRLRPDLLVDYATMMKRKSTLSPTETPFS